MIFKKPLLFAFSLSLISVQPAFAFCPRSANLQAIAEVRDHFEESPFIKACKESPDLLEGRPKTGLLVRAIPEVDGSGRSSREFLKTILSKVKERIASTTFQIQNMKTCIDRGPVPECQELNQWLVEDLPRYLKSARYHLSLAQSPHEISTWVNHASTTVNTSLDELGSYKFINWTPLTSEESERANSTLTSYQANIDGKIKKRFAHVPQKYAWTIDKYRNESLIAVRYDHYLTYRKMLAELPLLQHLKGPDVSGSDLLSAFVTMNKNLLDESKSLQRYERLLNKKRELDPEVLGLMAYNSQVEEALLADNKDCGLASSLLYTMTNRQIGNALVVGLPILAVSALAPPAAGLVIGGVAGGIMSLSSFGDFERTQHSTLGYVYGDSLNSDLPNLEEASAQKNHNFITLPLGMGVGGLAVRGISQIGKGAAAAGIKLFEGSP